MAKGKKLTKREHARRLAAYRATTRDREAAQLVGLTSTGFALWRYARGLPAKRKGGPRIDAAQERLRQRAYERGRSDSDAARIAGLNRTAFAYWRETRGLPRKGPPRGAGGPLGQRRLRVLQEARTDKEAARILGVTRQAITAWRTAQGIPSKKEPRGHSRKKRSSE